MIGRGEKRLDFVKGEQWQRFKDWKILSMTAFAGQPQNLLSDPFEMQKTHFTAQIRIFKYDRSKLSTQLCQQSLMLYLSFDKGQGRNIIQNSTRINFYLSQISPWKDEAKITNLGTAGVILDYKNQPIFQQNGLKKVMKNSKTIGRLMWHMQDYYKVKYDYPIINWISNWIAIKQSPIARAIKGCGYEMDARRIIKIKEEPLGEVLAKCGVFVLVIFVLAAIITFAFEDM